MNSQRGVVALITSIIVGLLLIVITAGGIALMGSELRQANDYDQSVKAYFAAESGIEDAIAVLRRDGIQTAITTEKPAPPGGCTPFNAPSKGINANLLVTGGNTQIGYTCQIVTTSDNKATGSQSAEAATQVDLNGVNSSFSTLRVSWNQASSPADPHGFMAADFPNGFGFPGGNETGPTGKKWPGNLPAVMELTVVSYPSSGTFGPTNITKDTIVLRPALGVSTAPQPYNTPASAQPVLVDCSKSDYNCQIDLTGFAGRTYLISLHARYSSTHYKIEALSGTGGTLAIPNAQLTIDVTGKAGSVFRRVQAKASLSPQTNFPLFTLLSDENICKVLEVLRTPDVVSTGGEKACVP